MSIESPFDPDQHRMDALTEGSGRSTFSAREQVIGSENTPGTAETVGIKATRKRLRRPLGRASAGIGGGDVSRMIANEEAREHPVSPEEHAESLRSKGHAEFLRIKEELKYKHSLEKAGDDPAAQRVMLRKLAEDKK